MDQYLFHGAPDMILSYRQKKYAQSLEEFVDIEGDDDSVVMTEDMSLCSSSSEDDVIEANRGIMTVHRGVILPPE